MKKLLTTLTAILAMSALNASAADSVHDLTVEDIAGEKVDLSSYKGKVLLIVNVASKCGYTKQYDNLQALHEKMKDQGVVVLGAPANNFGGQEPGSNEEIAEFCTVKFGVEFPMLAKTSAKGDDQGELFEYLTTAPNPDKTGDIGWNFEKFLVGKDGKVLRRFGSGTEPDSEEVVAAIEAALAAG